MVPGCLTILPCSIPFLLFVASAARASFDLEKALQSTCSPSCYNGICLNNSCVCTPGWWGKQCDHCHGRIRVTENQTSLIDSPVNYSSSSKCAWLLEHENSTGLTLHVRNFSTECGWDYLYVYEGNGAFGRQLTALCGEVAEFEISVPSGKGFVYFFSDLAQNDKGFNITLEYNRCAYNCNSRGTCRDGICSCQDGWTGDYCEQQVCRAVDEGHPGPCRNNGECRNGRCRCPVSHHGQYCHANSNESVWDLLSMPNSRKVAGRASHASVMFDDAIWNIGGEHFHGVPFNDVEVFNTTSRTWTSIKIEGTERPDPRYDHSVVRYKSKIYMFGGTVGRKKSTSELWSFDRNTRKWKLEHPENIDLTTAPQAVAGHTAHAIGNKMYVFFGYSVSLGFHHEVQVYDFETGQWSYSKTNDHVFGRYRHSSVALRESGEDIVLVYGGVTVPADSSNNITDSLMAFNAQRSTWTNLNPSGKSLFMHTATLINGLMVVIGGNSNANPSECFNGVTQIYDIACKQWQQPAQSRAVIRELRRFGHTAVTDDEKIWVVGGYNGTMLGDVMMFSPPDCTGSSKPDQCRSINDGTRCVFSATKCVKYNPMFSYPPDFVTIVKNEQPKTLPVCQDDLSRQAFAVCEELKSCLSCAAQSGCGWCVTGNQCLPSDADCVDGQEMIRTYSKCTDEVAIARPRPCSMANDCYSCKLLAHCNWFNVDTKPACISHAEQVQYMADITAREVERLSSSTVPVRINITPPPIPIGQNLSLCPLPCANHTNCADCTSALKCMWCASAERCVSMESYTISFPYGQCHSWTTQPGPMCLTEAANCTLYKTCKDCQLDPFCGWLDDGHGKGMGKCLRGTSSGPVDLVDYTPEQWFFVGCPLCQCNGHSECDIPTGKQLFETQVCQECGDHTMGQHCEKCAPGYFGDARNGGVCKPCECNGQADLCDPQSGICFCRTKGVVGDACDRCDTKYYGDPKNGRPCLYDLLVDFIFTFKLKNEGPDKYVTDIYLYSVPYKRDTDVTFQISCEGSSGAYVALNLTSNNYQGLPANSKPKMPVTACDAKGLRRFYLANDPGYPFGTDANTTFFVRVYNFTTPITIQISFAQSPPINWVLFFVIFAACFIVLLVVAGLLWMIKLRIEAYRNRQRQLDEIVHMASRPFSSVRLDLSNPHCNTVATPISIEPCSNYRAGVFTLAVRLPTGGKPTTPNGTSGMAVASALCLLTPAQLAVLQAPDNSDSRPNRKTNIRRYIPFLRRPENQ